MPKNTLLLLLTICWSANASAQHQNNFVPSSAHYLWPTNASHHLTSTFGETRLGHFHAALDIKTWGRRGYEVYATRDGILYRMAIQPNGYGKVLYLKHKDGSFSVYAHLMRFNNQLQHFADSLRISEQYRPFFDRVVEEEKTTIKQGDLIGYSGSSGIGPPHLHFELRTPQEKPFNPLLTNLHVKDNIAPTITGISVEPLSPGATIEGQQQIYTRRPYSSGKHYDFGSIEVTGTVGFAINAYDKANGVPNPYAVYKLSLSIDGQRLFTAKADSFSYAQTKQIYLDRVYPLLREHGKGYERLFVTDGNTLNFYQTDSSRGKLNLDPGIHDATITATDYAGNTSTAEVQLSVKEDSKRTFHYQHQIVSSPRKRSDVNFEYWDWLPGWVRIPKKDFKKLSVALTDWDRLSTFESKVTLNLHKLDNLFMNIPGHGPTIFRRLGPTTNGILTSIDKRAVATFPPHALFDTVSVTLSSQEYSPDSLKVTVGPAAYPLNKGFELRIKRSPNLKDTAKLAFYKYNPKYHYWFLRKTHFDEDYITMDSNVLGTFITRRDTTAPSLENPRLFQRTDGQWLIYFDVNDNLSGLDPDRSKITMNGQRGIAEYDPSHNRLIYYHPTFEPSSTMNITATVYDRMGNKTQRDFQIKK